MAPPCVESFSSLHVVLFPFMAKGHIIPMLHFTRLLLRRGAVITLFTMLRNRPFISSCLSDITTSLTIIDLPFPENIPGIPAGIESTDKLPSMSLFPQFASSTKLMRPHFEKELEGLPSVSFMVTDGFLGWTLDSANKFGIPRLVSYGMSNFAFTVINLTGPLLCRIKSDNEPFPVPDFPWIKVTRNDFERPSLQHEPGGTLYEFFVEQVAYRMKSHGMVVNSFYELEPAYADYWNSKVGPKAWNIGPFFQPKTRAESYQKPSWMHWLDERLEQGKVVLYVAFGSQNELSREQFEEIKIGLEKSEVNFLWVVRINEKGFDDGYEERVRDRGLVIREWVDQMEILKHHCVKGFVSHCGWNSVLESIWAKVPILAWPMAGEQPLNARFVADEIKVGLIVETADGNVKGFVKSYMLEKMVRELMEGEKGKEVRKKMNEIGEMAPKAVQEGGSSWRTLNELIHELTSDQRAAETIAI